MTDPLADMLARIRNAVATRKKQVEIPYSRFKASVAKVLLQEGYIVEITESSNPHRMIVLGLRYTGRRVNAIQSISRLSRPGQRVYVGCEDVPKIKSGLGTAVLSTSKGVLSDKQARKLGVGGELLCEVW